MTTGTRLSRAAPSTTRPRRAAPRRFNALVVIAYAIVRSASRELALFFIPAGVKVIGGWAPWRRPRSSPGRRC